MLLTNTITTTVSHKNTDGVYFNFDGQPLYDLVDTATGSADLGAGTITEISNYLAGENFGLAKNADNQFQLFRNTPPFALLPIGDGPWFIRPCKSLVQIIDARNGINLDPDTPNTGLDGFSHTDTVNFRYDNGLVECPTPPVSSLATRWAARVFAGKTICWVAVALRCNKCDSIYPSTRACHVCRQRCVINPS